ncbi:MAG: ABC transporter ATP-binding protein [Pyrinomonadaceae bacterium]|nr:ABC transporter ATP-binding protein [Pyrinomonadaceae bacterium]
MSNLPRGISLIWNAGKIWVIGQFFLMVVRGVLPAALIYLTKLFVDSVIETIRTPNQEQITEVIWLGISFAVLTILYEILGGVNSLILTAQKENLTDHVFELIHKKAAKTDLAFYEQPEVFNHLHRARAQARSRPAELSAQLGSILQNSVTLISMGIVLLRFGLWLPVVLFISTLPTLFVVVYSTSRLHAWQRKKTQDERESWYYDQLLTTGDSAAEIRLFGIGPYFRRKFVAIRKKLRIQQLRLGFRQRLLEFGASLFALVLAGGVFVWIVSQTIKGLGTVGDLALFYQAFNQGQGLMRTFLGDIGRLYSNSLFLSDLFEYLDLEPKVVSPKRPLSTPNDLEQGIALEKVTFNYHGSKEDVLKDFDLFIPAKKTVAVVGPNGAGKSTLIKLICRFYDPEAGSIKFDGTDLRDLSLSELRGLITVLFQAPFKYNTSAGENIALGDISRPSDQKGIETAAYEAGADEIIAEFGAGYEQMLGKRFSDGRELSGGEWQRIALARAFFRQSPIILLDEPTSSMDPWAEADWLKKFLKMAKDKTVVVITHRFTTASQADLIYVMEDGKIVETGSHNELLENDGRYASSWREQMAKYALNE